MKNTIKLALLPCIAALAFAAVPAQAVTMSSSSAPSASSTTLSKQQVKAQRKAAKQCAKLSRKLSSSKLDASRRAAFASKWNAMCKPAAATTTTEEAAKPSSATPASNNANSNAGSNANSNSAVSVITAAAPLFVAPPSNEKTGDTPVTQFTTDPYATDETPAAVPEPGTLALFGLGLLGLGLARRRSK